MLLGKSIMTSLSGISDLAEAAEQKPLRILLVDDEPLVREVLNACLAVDGHSVISVGDAREALEQIHSGAWDVVLTDRMMPGLSGEELAAEIKRFDPQIPVVLVTGMLDAIEHAADISMVDVFLRKPFTQQTLRDSIVSALNACPQRQSPVMGNIENRAA